MRNEIYAQPYLHLYINIYSIYIYKHMDVENELKCTLIDV